MIGVYISRVVRVYDGDTIFVDIDEWPPIVGKNMPVRIRGINCPEMNALVPEIRDRAKAAKAFTSTKIAKAEKIYLNNIQRGNYFRLIADVWLDGVDLGTELLGAKHAVRYSR